MSLSDSLVLAVHASPGVGKTTLLASTPAPRLIFDTEGGGTRFAFPKGTVTVWDPNNEPVPDLSTCEPACETVVVYVRQYSDISRAYDVLAKGNHQFRTVAIDTLGEAQVKLMEGLAGTKQLTQNQWGEVLRNFADLLRKFRDLTVHATNPLQIIVLTSHSEPRNGKNTLMLQGKVAAIVPAIVDVLGYMYVAVDEHGVQHRYLLVSPTETIDAKDRSGRLPAVIVDPKVNEILNLIFG